ncbi:VOC family protein [Marinitenerispora sediminis]|uniref:Glyoxalase n=1 Tax=Marinitenerispora sediminis TaxID=1931232 RepID=A0A368SYS8_9ACTN|nr:VOC family protein [Marinitenerispora sediminis]RCV47662.1 glyoxalase [Marinitenerispora sediminis]RCV48104.1 glyoxalase [Marinitenerispora sediminis]RCV49571.1 glyoxalase [Marinitenerispora sediminis]
MSILKTYARLWTDSLDHALPLLRQLTGRQPDLRLSFHGVELAAIGDFLVIAGPAEERAKYAHASATVVVTDLADVQAALKDAGAVITTPLTAGPTGSFLYARHADGAEIEYVQWTPDLVQRIVGRQQ